MKFIHAFFTKPLTPKSLQKYIGNPLYAQDIPYCAVKSCTHRALRPHHHHFVKEYLTDFPCQCPIGGELGTTREKND